tara:strand:- start:5130 stop:5480 length:351 start_codon:yes stop_codon:yes gene_type:complete
MALTKITSGVIAAEFTTSSNLTSAASVDVDWNSSQVFRITPNHSITFTFSDFKIGMVKIIVATGAGGSNTLAFPSEAVNLSGEYDDTTGTKNFIQIACTDDNGTPEFFYTISQPAA